MLIGQPSFKHSFQRNDRAFPGELLNLLVSRGCQTTAQTIVCQQSLQGFAQQIRALDWCQPGGLFRLGKIVHAAIVC